VLHALNRLILAFLESTTNFSLRLSTFRLFSNILNIPSSETCFNGIQVIQNLIMFRIYENNLKIAVFGEKFATDSKNARISRF